jgi:hypothetical protein
VRSLRDHYEQLAALHERLAEGWSLLGRDDVARLERDEAASLRQCADPRERATAEAIAR